MITHEHRHELAGVDVRLPGGKVCDSLQEYRDILVNGQDMAQVAVKAAIKEAAEETGLMIKSPRLVAIAKAGATVEWDLYYFLVKDYELIPEGQNLEHGEQIEVDWMSSAEIRQAITDGRMQEWRSIGVLLGLILPEIEG